MCKCTWTKMPICTHGQIRLWLFFFFALFKCIILLMVYLYVSTSFDLEPKTGLGFDPTSPNNKFVEREKKNQRDFRNAVTIVDGCGRIVVSRRYKNRPRRSPNSITKNLEFFFCVVFLNLFSICFSIYFSLDTFSRYIP